LTINYKEDSMDSTGVELEQEAGVAVEPEAPAVDQRAPIDHAEYDRLVSETAGLRAKLDSYSSIGDPENARKRLNSYQNMQDTIAKLSGRKDEPESDGLDGPSDLSPEDKTLRDGLFRLMPELATLVKKARLHGEQLGGINSQIEEMGRMRIEKRNLKAKTIVSDYMTKLGRPVSKADTNDFETEVLNSMTNEEAAAWDKGMSHPVLAVLERAYGKQASPTMFSRYNPSSVTTTAAPQGAEPEGEKGFPAGTTKRTVGGVRPDKKVLPRTTEGVSFE
jgi:hypothetical protein